MKYASGTITQRTVPIIALLFFTAAVHAQSLVVLPKYHDSLFSTYYHQRNSLFGSSPVRAGDVLFVGNSITDGADWSELFGDIRMKNRGISGDFTAGVLHRAASIVKDRPGKVFLMIGVNDLARGLSTDSVVGNILRFASYLRQESPATRLFVQSILPVSPVFGKFGGHASKRDSIIRVNRKLREQANVNGYTYIDLYPAFCDANGRLDPLYTNDGLHLLGEGYLLWKHLLFPHVHGLQEKPSIIPLPVAVEWKEGRFPLHQLASIVMSSDSLDRESAYLLDLLSGMGWRPGRRSKAGSDERYIELRLEKPEGKGHSPESYALSVDRQRVIIRAQTSKGIFYGIQTLRHLMRDGLMVDACEIIDRPAFAWRGYMIDVGRNYMPMDLLRKQIDVMAAYKLNVFHFHATEDIAWRIAISRYPQLTAPEHMLRNKGQYYTEDEIRSLIEYCRDRHILFLPEIDMPGHSAAFRSAMKTDMQSDTGMAIVKDILREFFRSFDLPYIHIGSDEVRITNPRFLPAMTGLLDSLGKEVIGWHPGGNLGPTTIRQVWREDATKSFLPSGARFIDSRHLYLNHMDPLESVSTIFNRMIAGRQMGDSLAIGATLCMWHDRTVSRAEDILAMNPVYPGMLAFAERSWRGGGRNGWIANLSDGDVGAFAAFESRLLEQKLLYFRHQPFPYERQSDLTWDLYGPFDNGGDVSRSFDLESLLWKGKAPKPTRQVGGGTVVLRHWWTPLVKGALDDPREHTTIYASTRIWSDLEEQRDAWIGFEDLSRSYASSTPPPGAWDYKGSTVWVNAQPIQPPLLTRAGQKGHPEIPLVDEGYAYRPPTKVLLKKGWNTVLIKLPVASFRARGPQDPVKWMYTFILLPRRVDL